MKRSSIRWSANDIHNKKYFSQISDLCLKIPKAEFCPHLVYHLEWFGVQEIGNE